MEPAVAAPSFWLATSGDDLTPRTALTGDVDVDVCVVGAGYTGLWTAYHLLRNDPSLRVAVLEAQVAGWGASGRNGGWCSALFAASWPRVARDHGRDAALRLRRALERTVDDVGAWAREHQVDIHYAKGGTLTFARTRAQLARLHAHVEVERVWGGEDTLLLSAADVHARVAASEVQGAMFDPHCAAIQPALLARGLARVVEAQGGRIYERTAALEVAPRRVVTAYGTVRADAVVRATEAYTVGLPGHERAVVPLWSLLVVTEPVPDAAWERIGWQSRETVSDERHVLIYAQRTADGRIAFGGRGAPYGFGSRTTGATGHSATFRRLERALHQLFPQVVDVPIAHRWSGVLGVPRDWMPSVGFDRTTGLGWGGGYVGDGVGCAALAGRTLADLVLGRDSELTTLPWVQHRSREWEPEPLRWLGIRGVAVALAAADVEERLTGRASRIASTVGSLMGAD
jgi:glycine/D-amino acid oxidase-like deaminating enzyme